MKRRLRCSVLILLLGSATQSAGQTTYNGSTVETPELRIEHRPVGDDWFEIGLTDKVAGLRVGHEFEGEGANDPSPFLLAHGRYCDTSVIMLTVEYPWRHDLPEFQRVLSTFAFSQSDFAFIDEAYGTLTDIALAEETAYDRADLDMLPPIRVRCLTGQDEKPFEFFRQETK
ncbi:MAG: hypothetical protein IOC92_04030 [Rhodobacter sp.]|nr:hypothetical protein [Rhodobacter sp.]MCA3457620.1 hypothetical protein [Rhodobacter sp.]MCA3459770.1 hypothetical protein [Rhodobacter sp.]MCA3464264.1 hypothetical protein [Rhodobacter sp.]MCA3467576.1 hypothetical protein [Rhodobacter sp.]